ncbi:hypothetical protein [Paenibacillus sp. DMB20]|uniref:hypothetical protein n=1 Tax=Paenibacillus sp. DMB20 TaxID=1642570 RepID=UPI00062800BB|nr:hypothetical protein [Paenibacillus sp. DMB20]KKO55250.1 hypothetical protein XI25_01935 [Paenibacillus sp. DMB20]
MKYDRLSHFVDTHTAGHTGKGQGEAADSVHRENRSAVWLRLLRGKKTGYQPWQERLKGHRSG